MCIGALSMQSSQAQGNCTVDSCPFNFDPDQAHCAMPNVAQGCALCLLPKLKATALSLFLPPPLPSFEILPLPPFAAQQWRCITNGTCHHHRFLNGQIHPFLQALGGWDNWPHLRYLWQGVRVNICVAVWKMRKPHPLLWTTRHIYANTLF